MFYQVVLPSPSKTWRRPYSKSEQKDMVEFLVEKRAYSLLGGNTIWQQMEEGGACGGRRTWQSMKEHFKKQLITRIHTFGLTWQQVRKFRAAFGHDEPLQSSEDEDIDDEHVEEGGIDRCLVSSGSSAEPRHGSPRFSIERREEIPPVNAATIRQGSVGGSPVLRQSPRAPSSCEKDEEVVKGGNQSLEEGGGHRPRERKRKLFSKVDFPFFRVELDHYFFSSRQPRTSGQTRHIPEELCLLQCSGPACWMTLRKVARRESLLKTRESRLGERLSRREVALL